MVKTAKKTEETEYARLKIVFHQSDNFYVIKRKNNHDEECICSGNTCRMQFGNVNRSEYFGERERRYVAIHPITKKLCFNGVGKVARKTELREIMSKYRLEKSRYEIVPYVMRYTFITIGTEMEIHRLIKRIESREDVAFVDKYEMTFKEYEKAKRTPLFKD